MKDNEADRVMGRPVHAGKIGFNEGACLVDQFRL